MEYSLCIDFGTFGVDMNHHQPGLEIPMEYVTKYGYICNIVTGGQYPLGHQ